MNTEAIQTSKSIETEMIVGLTNYLTTKVKW